MTPIHNVSRPGRTLPTVAARPCALSAFVLRFGNHPVDPVVARQERPDGPAAGTRQGHGMATRQAQVRQAAQVAADALVAAGTTVRPLSEADAAMVDALAERYGRPVPNGGKRDSIDRGTVKRRHAAAQQGRCAWCGDALTAERTECDRTVSGRGYALTLVVAACDECNALRGALAERGYALTADAERVRSLPRTLPTVAAERADTGAMVAAMLARHG